MLILSFLILSTLGTILHFTNNWFKDSIFIQVISAINESTWEHMKLLVFPTILVMFIQYYTLDMRYPNFFSSVLTLLLVQTLAIPLLYEPLRVIFKRVHFIVTIIIFYVSVLFGVLAQYYALQNNIIIFNEPISLIIIAIITLIYWIFTYYPPKIWIFRDPNTRISGYK